jgi:hypothetical protein
MKAFALDTLSRIISPEVGATGAAGAWTGAVTGSIVCAELINIKPNRTNKNEVQNLLTFSGI